MANRLLYLARHGEAVDDGNLTARGRQQADLLGERLATVPLTAIHHGPLPRAAQTADLISRHLPGVPMHCSDVVGDYVPPVPDLQALREVYARFLDGVTAEEYATGATLAAAALQQHAVPTTTDSHELVITHSFLIAWFVRHALDAPDARWLGLNAANCALTVLLYRPHRPPTLVSFNDTSHLPPELRWTGFPPELHV
ncbi:histidine phosphatase family protein [Couchioplanes azureus]|uniref:histidine phosphatase family protein n=1 Tax=Couchioplanes caeruleus TaxID=56438 RepID=UPI001994814B|nr:histidine phosphatase family protein [Couchioplanes caeruleus]GGQ56393.1 phosphoglycerate mutase [Couchioplanes caeruleus subsp. azureus]